MSRLNVCRPLNCFVIITLSSVLTLATSCESSQQPKEIKKENWKNRAATLDKQDSLIQGRTYLSVYPQIHSLSDKRMHDLTTTVSIRNTNEREEIYLEKAEYFNTKGQLVRTYFDFPVSLKPMETVEIILKKEDNEGGTGANFNFLWSVPQKATKPYFEAVMISTAGQQGISFVTTGVEVNR